MRKLPTRSVLVATLMLGVGVPAPALAAEGPGAGSERAMPFTPPIGSDHGSVLARADAPHGPSSFELDLGWGR